MWLLVKEQSTALCSLTFQACSLSRFQKQHCLSVSPGLDFIGFAITILPANSVQIVPNSREMSVLSGKFNQVSHAKFTVSTLNIFNYLCNSWMKER